MSKRFVLVCVLALLGIVNSFSHAFANDAGGDAAGLPMAAQALAVKSDRVVIFYDAQKNEIGRYDAAFGQGKGAKRIEGDLRTPEGDYFLAPARPSNEWGWFMPISYPSDEDVQRAKSDGRSVVKLGGAIGLHAVGDGFMRNVRQSFGENWTFGCIAVTDRSMSHIRQMVRQPIPLRIVP